MAFSLEDFRTELRTPCFGREVRWLEETTSTIDVAQEWLAGGGPEGGVVIAGRQVQGRGRNGRVWVAPEGGLWMSVLARPRFGIGQAGRLGMAMALATAEGVEAVSGVRAELKWPNDVVVAGRKLAGVLVETQTEGGVVTAAVLSVGLNVNVERDDLPEAVRERAATLREVTGREERLEVVAARVLEALEGHWVAVLGEGAELAEAWQGRDALLGECVCVELAGAGRKGVGQGVTAEGALRLLSEGVEHLVTVGEVSLVRTAR